MMNNNTSPTLTIGPPTVLEAPHQEEATERVTIRWQDVDVPELLPNGWEPMKHDNNLIFYYHRESGVISWSRPYLRKWQTKDHIIPLAVFPQLLNSSEKFKNQLYEERKIDGLNAEKEDDKEDEEVEKRMRILTEEPVENYENVEELKDQVFWLVTEIVRAEKTRKHRSYEDYLNNEDSRKWRKLRPSELNPENKSPVTFLQEYCFHVLRRSPAYEASIQEDPGSPFVTKVLINGKEVAKASWTNKKLSKQVAALNALAVLCPELYPQQLFEPYLNKQKQLEQERAQTNLNLSLNDERLLIADGTEKTPAQVLLEHCNRADLSLIMDTKENMIDTQNRFLVKISVANFEAEAYGRSKKEAKQRACQQILQKMHPHFKTWGELLQHYMVEKVGSHREKSPNISLLNKLKKEMLNRYPKPPSSSAINDSPPQEEEMKNPEDKPQLLIQPLQPQTTSTTLHSFNFLEFIPPQCFLNEERPSFTKDFYEPSNYPRNKKRKVQPSMDLSLQTPNININLEQNNNYSNITISNNKIEDTIKLEDIIKEEENNPKL